jgi:Pro-kumamolisin, activation domain
MSKSRALVFVLFAAAAVSSPSYGATPDRVVGDLITSQKVALHGNVHGLARPEFDLGRADGGRVIEGITLSFRPSPAQQQDLNGFLAQLADPHSKNFHKYLTPAEFGERFGMSRNDLDKITAWLQAEGFTNVSVANGRNQISFDGSVAQLESVFAMEMHHYLVDGVVHLANSGEPSVPTGLAGIVGSLWHINDFSPRPRISVKRNLTSYVSGFHYLTPGDFAKIYNLGTLYSAGGTGQKIAVVGQSTVSTTDLNNFRSAAGFAASTVTMTLVGGTATRCAGDEVESDFDIEWSGGVAQNASVTFLYAGLGTNDTCAVRTNSVWNALAYAIQHNVAPFISTSYGFCESGLGQAFVVSTLQPLIQQGQAQGQTVTAASGDSGAADCDSGNTATQGLAVDAPASIPEVTGAGGNEFFGDAQATVTGTPPTAQATANWGASGAGTDAPIITALGYIQEEAWNDTTQSLAENPSGGLSASGGGASIYFTKPSWQTGTGVPADGQRDVPDISVSASQFHDSDLFCSEDGPNGTIVQTCTAGFRTGPGGMFTTVGGTSVAAPSITAILALINQFLGNPGTTGLAPVNPTLYSLAASTPSAFHDVTTDNTASSPTLSGNMVPCRTGSPDCPPGTTAIGFNVGVGYDQVTGWGSPNVTNLANAWAATLAQFTVTAGAVSPASVPAGSSATVTITVAATSTATATGETVNFGPSSCSPLPGVQCTSFSPNSVVVPASGSVTTTLTIQTAGNMAAGPTQFTVTGTSGTTSASTSVSLTLSATTMSFSLSTNLSGGTVSVVQGQSTAPINIVVGSSSTPSFLIASGSGNSTALPLTYTLTGLPSGANYTFTPASPTSSTTVTLILSTTASTSRLQPPFEPSNRIFYALLLPGLLGIGLTVTPRKQSTGAARMLALILALGLSTLWMASCSGTNGGGNKITGTPTGNYTVIVSATTGGAAPISNSVTLNLSVTP